MTTTWIVQVKTFRGDWTTVASFDGTREEALKRYEHLTDPRCYGSTRKLRAVSEKQAELDYEAGRADGEYRRYLKSRGISEVEHGREIGEWLDQQD